MPDNLIFKLKAVSLTRSTDFSILKFKIGVID